MSNTLSSQRRMSVDVHAPIYNPAHIARPPCSPITNEAPILRKKGSFSFANFIRPSSRAPSPTPKAPKPKKVKKEAGPDLATMYGADFARAVAANQFLNGGSLESAIERVRHDQEKMARRRAAKAGVPYVPDGAAPIVGRNGELFRDAADESERRGLLRDAYKGMPAPGSKARKIMGMRDEDEFHSADEDSAAPWERFTASSASTVRRDSARADFFASSFVPGVPPRRV